MRGGFSDVMGKQLLACTMNLGRGTRFGIFKYANYLVAIYSRADLIVLLNQSL